MISNFKTGPAACFEGVLFFCAALEWFAIGALISARNGGIKAKQ
jgi:hypothetical protein